MFADQDNTSLTGLRALLGHLLHLLPARLFQLVRAVWSFMIGPWGPSALSLLPSGWVVHRSVQPEELPRVFEALGLHSRSWERLGERCDGLGLDTGLQRSCKEFPSSQHRDSLDLAIEELTIWQKAMTDGNLNVFWEPRLVSWEDWENECRYQTSVDLSLSSSTYSRQEKNGPPLPSASGVAPCLSCVKSDEFVTWVEEYDDHHKNAFVDFPAVEKSPWFLEKSRVKEALTSKPKQDVSENESHYETSVDHHLSSTDSRPTKKETNAPQRSSTSGEPSCTSQVKSKSILTWIDEKDDHHENAFANFDEVERSPWFLEKSQVQEDLTSKLKQDFGEMGLPGPPEFLASIQCAPVLHLDPKVFEGHQSQFERSHDLPELFNVIDLSKESILNLAGMDEEFSYGERLNILDLDPHHNCPPSPEKDQGYNSLEDWQCLAFTQNIQGTPMQTPETHESKALLHSPVELSTSSIALNPQHDDQKNETDSNPGNEILISLPTCRNKHIGYILGTIVSDDEIEDFSSDQEDEEEKEESDDGFDSEGSVSSSDREASFPEEIETWGSFHSSDPYSLQHFTASLQTGSVPKETLLLPEHRPRSDDEESWCDSDAQSDSEEDSSADEQENQKLWNAFVKSDDPYNLLQFKAPVQTKRQSGKNSEIVCRNLPKDRLDLPTCQEGDPRHLSLEKRTRSGHKKVTFLEKVTVYNVYGEEERKGQWEELARDRCRFQRRIKETESTIGHCLCPSYRKKVWQRMQEQWGS